MKRLTDDKTAEGIKRICDGLIAQGVDPETIISDLRYVKLAEYERIAKTPEELREYIGFLLEKIKGLQDKIEGTQEKQTGQIGWAAINKWFPDKMDAFDPFQPPKEVQDSGTH